MNSLIRFVAVRRCGLFSALLALRINAPVAAQTTYTPYQFVTIAGTAGSSGSADGVGSTARFSLPGGITVDGSGNVFVADSNNDTVREITPGGMVTTIAGSPGVSGVPGGIGVPGSATRFHFPRGVAVDTNGDFLLVADTQNLQWQGLAKSVTNGATAWTTTALSNFNSLGGGFYVPLIPVGVSVAANGSDGYGTVIGIQVGASTGSAIVDEPFSGSDMPAYLAGSAVGNSGSNDGPANAATFNNPIGLAVDVNADLYVADNGNDSVRKITPTPVPSGTEQVVSTFAGLSGSSGSADGTGSAARFNGLSGVAVDASGNVYVADTNNDTIRKITPAGVVTTLGGIPGVAGSADGTGSAALFNQPYGIAVDASGNIYVTDAGNNTIREGFVPNVPPTFTLAASPATANIATGRTAVFNATAAGTAPLAYQWTLNGSTTIPGAAVTNDPILVITGATASDSGTIACTVTNAAGHVTSSATLAVAPASNPGYITNLSGRGLVGSGPQNALFGGFGISGSGTKQLLIRGMGPSLLPGPPYFFNVADALTDTALTLYDEHSNPIDFNSPWGGTNALIAADTLTGAYAPVSTASLDSMLYLPVSTGGSSASVGGANGATGDAVIEVYDADTPPLVNKLINISVRAPVGTGGDILFGGFVIGGTTDETLLIRAVGPGLVAYFGPSVFTPAEVLAQPVLTVFTGSTPTGYTNTVWGGDQALVNAMTVTGAYPIPTNTLDSMLLITLPPGDYSAEVTGVNNTTGIATVEVYEVY